VSPWLSDDEVEDATRRRQPARQAKLLEQMGVPYQRRPDGTLLVGRAAMEAALAGTRLVGKQSSNGLKWSRA
jgi:hypothetical protein